VGDFNSGCRGTSVGDRRSQAHTEQDGTGGDHQRHAADGVRFLARSKRGKEMVSVRFPSKENEPTPFVPQRRSCPILGQFADDDAGPQTHDMAAWAVTAGSRGRYPCIRRERGKKRRSAIRHFTACAGLQFFLAHAVGDPERGLLIPHPGGGSHGNTVAGGCDRNCEGFARRAPAR
jgi:hypothetical protein